MKKKKALSLLLCGTMAIAGIAGLAGCGGGKEPHVHAYSNDLYYTIETEGDVKKVYSHKECPCGDEKDKVLVENAVIATPENAQNILDGYGEGDTVVDINNKIVVFDGTFTEKLFLRPTLNNAELWTLPEEGSTVGGVTVTSVRQWRQGTLAYKAGTLTEDEISKGVQQLTDTSIGSWADGTNKTVYNYVRHLNNITFTSTEKSEFQCGINIISTHASTGSQVNYDPIRKEDVTAKTLQQFYQHLNINGLKFSRLNFKTVQVDDATKVQGQIKIYDNSTVVDPTTKINELHDITVTSCNFSDPTRTGKGAGEVNAAVYVETGRMMNDRFVNFTYTNNTVNGNYQGVHVKNVNGATFKGNSFKNTYHNPIAVQSTDSTKANYATGKIVIENNKEQTSFVEYGGVPFRFKNVKNAEIIIRNNEFKNINMKFMKMDTLMEGSTVTSTGNKYDGKTIAPKTLYGTVEGVACELYIPGYPVVAE